MKAISWNTNLLRTIFDKTDVCVIQFKLVPSWTVKCHNYSILNNFTCLVGIFELINTLPYPCATPHTLASGGETHNIHVSVQLLYQSSAEGRLKLDSLVTTFDAQGCQEGVTRRKQPSAGREARKMFGNTRWEGKGWLLEESGAETIIIQPRCWSGKLSNVG